MWHSDDRLGHVVHRVDLGERHAVVAAVGLDGEDAAVGLDRRGTLAGVEEDARQAALERHRGARPALLAIAACAAWMSGVSAARRSPPPTARLASASAVGA